ncbi:electron transfer flavoprotein beta subunit [Azospirillum brasilense]|uniref:Protein FixA n=1 Tax=Azospirillum brasilense TaxID=192 RepID=A0A560C161_AZOBR|nr:electron transfer flavoprotein subunit beta/FixA family protein [Azospirillum brasilense]MBK3736721.1 nitrogen fixation protein FixA [Azospirillum brasilense]TWA78596.1 electron transfer flavoprotein beta subunit [Azospirillum brasilense]
MHIVVCIKQVPDSAQIRIHPVTNTIMRQGVPAIINPFDLFSLEEALRIKDKVGARVTVLTMGPPMAETSLRKALSLGADDAVLLTDRKFAGSDTLATSYALTSAIKKLSEEEQVDLVFCGKQTVDGDTAQVGPGIATRLGFQQLTYITKIESIDQGAREIVVHRRSEGGVQVLKTALPCMITMLEGTNTIRFGKMDDMFRAARYGLKTWSKDTTGAEETKVGLKGSPTVVSKVFVPKPRAQKATMVEAEAPTAEAPSAEAMAAAAVEAILGAQPKLADELLARAAAGL